MQKTTLKLFLLLIAVCAVSVTLFWAVRPLLTPLLLLLQMGWTDADIINRYWHFRLIQPEWLSNPPDYYLWARTETLTRLAIVFVAWAMSTIFVVRQYCKTCKQPTLSN
ncbi:MAG TPA: hypothetical protein VNN22_14470 [Verrucomicrobiae bacterium]|nr:hypothetical protein [Verrucomicrobiae bacterium]